MRRSVITTTSVAGGGSAVSVDAIGRQIDGAMARLERDETAQMARHDARAAAMDGYLTLLGQPEDEISPAARLSKFQAATDLLAARPGDADAQRAMLDSAAALARGINGAAEALVEAESEANVAIARDVHSANEILTQLEQVSRALQREVQPTVRRAALQDTFDRGVDALAEIMDFEVSIDAANRITIHTSGGTPLLDRTGAADLEWNAASGTLMAGDIDVTPARDGVRGFAAGSLAGRIEVLSHDMPQAQLQLDEFARSLVQRFEDADTSLVAGQAGLFTDDGAAFDPTRLDGLSARLAVNDAVRPEAGGALWRLRDGVGATESGPVLSTTQIDAFVQAMSAPGDYAAATGLASAQSLGSYAADMVSDQQQVRVVAERESAVLSAGLGAIAAARSGVEGVNVDTELQNLMMIEQAYAANSQVLSTLTDMLDTLLNAA